MIKIEKICIYSALFVYTFAVLLFALPKYFAVTVYKAEPPASLATTTTKKKPSQIKNLATPHEVSPQAQYYRKVATEEAIAHNLDPKMFTEVINCESSYNSSSNHDGGHGKGITGFWKQTFDTYNKKLAEGKLDYSKQEDQVKLMAMVFADSEKNRSAWTTYTKYQKYGVCFDYQIKNKLLTINK